MVKRGESLTPEHRAAIGRGVKRNATARAERARQANEASARRAREAEAAQSVLGPSLSERLRQQAAPRTLHAHRADEACNPSCTQSGRGGTSPCACTDSYQCTWCKLHPPADQWLVLSASVKLEPGFPVPTTELLAKALGAVGLTTVADLDLRRVEDQ